MVYTVALHATPCTPATLPATRRTYDERPSMEELLQHPWLAKHGYVPVDLADAASDDRREGTGTLSSQDARVSRSVEFSRSVPVHAVVSGLPHGRARATHPLDSAHLHHAPHRSCARSKSRKWRHRRKPAPPG